MDKEYIEQVIEGMIAQQIEDGGKFEYTADDYFEMGTKLRLKILENPNNPVAAFMPVAMHLLSLATEKGCK